MQNIKLSYLLKKDFEILNRKKILIRTQECEKIYKFLLSYLKKKLNNIHNVNYSEKKWEIILSFWLKNYIYYLFKNYKELKFLIKKNKPNLIIFDGKNITQQVDSTYDFLVLCKNKNFNLILNYKLLRFFFKKKKYLKKNFSIRFLYSRSNNFLNKFLIFFLSKINTVLNFFSKEKNFISHTYIPFFYEKKLEYLTGKIPSFYIEPKINYSNYNYKLRNKLNYKPGLKNFLNIVDFAKINLKYYIPKAFVEDFKQINLLSQSNLYPKKINFIFTSVLQVFDEAFKFFVSSNLKKIPLIIGQHGGNYFTRSFIDYAPDLKINDYFFSWGHKNKKNIYGFFNFKVLNKKILKISNINNVKKDSLVIVLGMSEIVLDPSSNIVKRLHYLKKFISNLKNLDKDILKKTIVRLPKQSSDRLGINYNSLFEGLDIEIDDGRKNFTKILNKAKLCIFNYDSTGFLENTLNNIPSIVLEDKYYLHSIKKNQIPKYNSLIKNNVMFIDSDKAVKHVNTNWTKIYNWWSSSNVRKSVDFFNKNLNIKPNNNSLEMLAKHLKRIGKHFQKKGN
jgi:putative transferase (TIGR04331 family)